jgi:hypothetical protein
MMIDGIKDIHILLVDEKQNVIMMVITQVEVSYLNDELKIGELYQKMVLI